MAKQKGVYPRTFEYVDHEHNMAFIELRITFIFSPSCPAQIYGDPSRCYPAESAEWEIDGAELQAKDGTWFKIAETDWLFDWCRDALDGADEASITDCLPDDRE